MFDGCDAQAPVRREVAIAFADVVGYSILTSADEEGTHRRWMSLYRRVVEPEAVRHGGRVAELRGDGVLAEFPDPHAALSWARGLHAASAAAQEAEPTSAPLAFRIAIHFGRALTGKDGLFGDAVNLAARLQEFGAAGGTILSADAVALLGPEQGGAARDLGELPMRNMSRAVRAFSFDPVGGAVPVPLPPPPARLPSIAVLPLANVTGEADDDYLAEGICADVIASLAGLHEVFVIAQDSVRMFRSQRLDPLRVGRVMGVRFVATGRLLRVGQGLRVAVDLVDTEVGASIWGERFDIASHEILDVQDQVVTGIVAGIVPKLRTATLRDAMRKRPENLTAYDLTLRGMHAMGENNAEGFRRALRFFRKAIAEDPGFALPVAWAARWHSLNIGYGWSTNPEDDNRAAMSLAQRAIALDGTNAMALATYGHLTAYLLHDSDTAMDCFERALAACPNSALAWTLSAGTLSYVGRGRDAVLHATRGMRLSPYDPLRFSQQHFISIAHYTCENLPEAERWARLCIGSNPAHASSWRVLAAVLAALGRAVEAREAMARLLELEPGFRLANYVKHRMPMREPALRARFERDLRDAGGPL
ncbi:adenylate/guanylate cyclase domain-containing protein [Siccirubricoccus sp. KC 17139]|uniref:Adenylate/guanylate cyclase domain-containing protein n=1 Tax=Siccirubricoccus soli TaxID=2899147 RepID=A0ABT1D4X3_9PROT|nr:adenylate/guanylate cyclase domain-containing protein [Siccirubricoccus soli]MCO6416973.1 adenylate/guanylate cyclase domain-containing protein [Siccirubricoccus soli]MCP2683108.1 adenylate/guanylate cyclase domain-containing protein [Siccirubricoccus soli]